MTAAPGWADWAAAQLDVIRAEGRHRSVRDFDSRGPSGRLAGSDTQVVSFASNDYLGLTAHPVVVAAAHAALERWGAGSGSARLIVGGRPVHSQLERALADWRGDDAALVFPTGFAANLGVLTVLGGRPGTVVLSDELNHASIIDGSRLSRAQVEVYPHGDLDWVAKRLDEAGNAPVVVVSDTVFSMDGDLAPVDALLALCAERGAALVLDEAHAVLGPAVPDAASRPGTFVVRVGTLSKTLGALGGFATGPSAFVDLLRNRARSFIFTTAPTPADSAAALAALGVVRSDEGARLVGALRANVDRLRPGHPSPIVAIVVGGEEEALAASAALLERGLLVPAIRPPTVAPGTCRLRVALSAAHTADQVDELAGALRDLGLAP